MSLRVRRLQGASLLEALPDLARLRIEVFRDFPYLYEGSFEYEKKYLEIYTRSSECAVIAVYDQETMIGAATALPLKDENPYIQEPFLKAGMDPSQIFYFGESVLKKDYRGQGVGHLFFDEREKVARESGKYKITCFCAVQRPNDHPLRPTEYRPLDEFWKKRGYRKEPLLQALFRWQDINENVETEKPMVYWLKEWM